MTVQIDPATGERVGASPSVDIDPETGERKAAKAEESKAAPTGFGEKLKSEWDNLRKAATERVEPSPNAGYGERVLTSLNNIGARATEGVGSMIAHPIKSALGMGQMFEELTGQLKNGPIEQRIEQFKEEYREDPAKAVENATGDVFGMWMAGKFTDLAVKPLGPGAKGLLEKSREMRARATGTGPNVTADLVKNVSKENTDASGVAAGETAKAEAFRQKEIAKVSEQRNEIKSGVEAAKDKAATEAAKQEKIKPTANKLQQAWSNLRAGVETAREKALKSGNVKYSAVNEKLSKIPASKDFIDKSLLNAGESLRGSTQDTSLMKQMQMEYAEKTPTYNDLQGDYSRLGKELTKGTLPGDLYHAYDMMHEAIGKKCSASPTKTEQGRNSPMHAITGAG